MVVHHNHLSLIMRVPIYIHLGGHLTQNFMKILFLPHSLSIRNQYDPALDKDDVGASAQHTLHLHNTPALIFIFPTSVAST